MSERPVILTFVRSYLPGYKHGGPIRTIVNMVDQLSDRLDFRIVTLDRDGFDEPPYSDVRPNEWVGVGEAQVFYASPNRLSISSIRRAVKDVDYDVLYLNSFFDYSFTLKPLVMQKLGLFERKPVVVAVRGELSARALEVKPLKKRLFLSVSGRLGLYENVTFQASTQLEANDIKASLKRHGFKSKLEERIVVACDLAGRDREVAASVRRLSKDKSALTLCFLSRLDRTKNLHFALELLFRIRVPVRFRIYGPVADVDYWTECQRQIEKLPDHIKVEYSGSVPHEDVINTLGDHDLFIFPTLGENYGHVIHEALLAGVPVLTSDRTPWVELERYSAGWCIPLSDQERFAKIIEDYATLSQEDRDSMSRNARQYGLRVSNDRNSLETNYQLFYSARNYQRS